MVAHKTTCRTVKGFFEINDDMIQVLLIFKVLFTKDSKVEDLFCGAPSGPDSSMFFGNYLFGLGFKPLQDDFQHDFARMIFFEILQILKFSSAVSIFFFFFFFCTFRAKTIVRHKFKI